ncbi:MULTISPECIES: hypothetical protein [Mycolicibacter]|uniref:Uncharacterized protein n=1 Tax=[Mycobacterium] nativiensis TaxID=2855503 RepID=A0ABU5Y4R1_9MYCO|nr:MULTISPECIES: hypothetical protein [unclassified Mycolicibacter]MEB3035052.1 hypothetical protein [Mycolicibacter sp. MYC340]MEB3061995.1 hypothetical protein [Mycolicibacter sp. MYC101]
MSNSIVHPLGVIAAGLLAVGIAPAGVAFAAPDADGATPAPGAGAVVTTSAGPSGGAQPAPIVPAAPMMAGASAPAGPATPPAGCHVVWFNVFAAACMPGK